MQQHFINPASVLEGRKLSSKSGRIYALKKAIPLFWAARNTLGVLMLIPLYLWMRLPNLMALPVFYDETIYLSYAREYILDPQRNLLISAERDGKPPLFVWALSWVWNWFDDPLTGARMLSVIGGGVTCIFIYLIGKRVLSPVAGFIATLFYILCPLMVLHNRLAVHSSWESAAGMAALYFACSIAMQPRALYALGLGAALGLGMFVKQTALFAIGLAPLVAFILHRRPDIWERLKNPQLSFLRKFSLWWYRMRVRHLPQIALNSAMQASQLINERKSANFLKVARLYKIRLFKMRSQNLRGFLYMALIGFLGIAIAGAAYLPLQTSKDAAYLSSTDTSYALTFKEVLAFPLDLWHSNFSQTWEWWLIYYNIPLLVLALAAFGYAIVRPRWGHAELVLICWAILPIIAQMILARQHWFSRYITPFGPPMLLLAAFAIYRLGRYLIRVSRERMGWSGAVGVAFGICLVLITIAPWVKLDDQIINRPAEAQLATRDRWQYIEGWPSGYGLEESLNTLRDLAATAPILIYIDQDNVTPEIYYMTKLSQLKGWVFFGRTTEVNWLTRNFRGERNTYYITTVQPDEMLRPYLKLVKSFPKPGGQSSITIYHFVEPENKPEIPYQ
ncbi:glycosyltransferase family 39 protein [Candidatus Chlorohelix sp.]|uniref:ArnT family glycosyltransferase n=1 Tax=Candidatus Chlorohelix sp. TaxID=3139201 RepID=UPI00305BAAE6